MKRGFWRHGGIDDTSCLFFGWIPDVFLGRARRIGKCQGDDEEPSDSIGFVEVAGSTGSRK